METLLVTDIGSSFCGLALFLPFVVVLALMIYGVIRARDTRRNDLSALASRLGFDFRAGADTSFADRYQGISLFTRGGSRKASCLLTGFMTVGDQRVPVLAADYSYVITKGTGKRRRRRTYHVGIVMAHLPFRGLPEFIMRDETVIDRITAAIGFDDIDYESAEFSRRFHVKCADRRFASDLIDPEMIDYMLATDAPDMEIEGSILCTQYPGVPDVEEVESALEWMRGFLVRWPDHLVKSLVEGKS